MINLQEKSVLVTGLHGFLGQYIGNVLKERGAILFSSPQKHKIDLREPDRALDLLDAIRPQYIIHAAGHNGGIVYNKENPARIFHDNVLMGLNVLYAAQKFGVQKVISLMASCAYPDTGKELLRETEFWDGPCNPTVECHGLAKRTLDAYSRFLNQQHKFSAHTLCLTNLYGPGDRFSNRGKVVSMLIKKFVQAQEEGLPSVEVLGSGAAMREFMYVDDAAEAVVRSLECYDNTQLPLNIGTGQDISIKSLVNLLIDVVGYKGEVVWNLKAGDGQLKKLLDVTRMRRILNYEPGTRLEDGLRRTVDWYKEERKKQKES